MTKTLAAIVLLLCLATSACAGTSPRLVGESKGGLVYATTQNGDRMPDFSTCGYRGGDQPIQNVPVRCLVTHKPGDATARIQAAIDYVASLPPDERGAILLQPGEYEVAGGLKITASGVVLRGSGIDKTIIRATGRDRRTVVTIAGKDDRKVDSSAVAIADAYVPVNASKFHVANATGFKAGDTIVIRRPSTPEWIKAIGMDDMGGERHGFSWKPGTRDLVWDRTVTKVDGNTITIDSPLMTALDKKLGGGTVARYEWAGRVREVGVENLTLASDYDKARPADEDHAWFGVTMENARDSWVRQVAFRHLAGSAVAVYESCSRVTCEDLNSFEPISQDGGYRRHTFFTAGQQTLFQRCHSEQGRHDFSVGFCSPGPNAFVQCDTTESLNDSGPIDSWAAGVLFDNVRIDGNAITFGDRRWQAQGAGWSTANSVLWQCHASIIRCFAPPTANNWAIGCWSTFDGDGVWQSSNDSVSPQSLYYAQLADRIGKSKADPRAQLMTIDSDPSSSPTIEEAAALIRASKDPAPRLVDWIANASSRTSIPLEIPGSGVVSDPEPKSSPSRPAARRIAIIDGVITIDGKPLAGKRQSVMWWRGTVRANAARETNQPSITRFVPGRSGAGWTDDLDQLADEMVKQGEVSLDHNYGLWYDRRRDDHERVRRIDGDAWPPFFEQPFLRTGPGTAWDGLLKYDLSQYNPWYFDRLKQFATLGDAKGIVLLNHHYFQHNILEAGAHYADFPWRTANNVNATGFPEPPPYAGDKRIFLAEQFYDLSNETRRKLHEAYIRHQLDNVADNANVIHLISYEFTGPQHFVEFWLNTIAAWEKETGKHPLIALSCTKDVQDAILADETRAKVVDVIDIRYWWPQANGQDYAPKGGQNLAPRQHLRLLSPKPTSAEQIGRVVREYRQKYPTKAVIVSVDGAERFGDAIRAAGGSLAP
jgi:hypothetical protein